MPLTRRLRLLSLPSRYVDLAYLVTPWCSPGVFLGGSDGPGAHGFPARGKGWPDAKGGFLPEGVPTKEAFLAQYCQLRGITPPIEQRDFVFYEGLNWFRKAAIGHGVYARALAGNVSSSRGLSVGDGSIFAMELGLRVTGLEPAPGAPAAKL